jgi:outer membrane protein TolC
MQQFTALQEQLDSQDKEMSILQEFLRFNELRFQQGKIEFDTLIRTRLEISAAKRTIQNLRHQITLLELKRAH